MAQKTYKMAISNLHEYMDDKKTGNNKFKGKVLPIQKAMVAMTKKGGPSCLSLSRFTTKVKRILDQGSNTHPDETL